MYNVYILQELAKYFTLCISNTKYLYVYSKMTTFVNVVISLKVTLGLKNMAMNIQRNSFVAVLQET